MTLDEARQNVGAGVVYRPHPNAPAEDGEIVRVGEAYVHVLYVGDRTPKATRANDLILAHPMKRRTVSADDLETMAFAAHAPIELPGPEGGWAVAVINGREYRAAVAPVPDSLSGHPIACGCTDCDWERGRRTLRADAP